ESLLKPHIGAKGERYPGIDIHILQQVHCGRFTSFFILVPCVVLPRGELFSSMVYPRPCGLPSGTEIVCESQSLISWSVWHDGLGKHDEQSLEIGPGCNLLAWQY